ncbi:casein kinase I isoform delta [Suillus ampliporus]|nr:casein kinase I isoform delta [Suillus ampliporus]
MARSGLAFIVDGRFRLGDVVGSGSYTVVYHAWNIIKDDAVAIKLEPITSHSSSIQCEYTILKRLEGGVGVPHALCLHTVVNLGDQLLSHLEYIHSHNYVHSDIKQQNVLVGLDHLRHTAFIIDFVHIPFCQNQHLTDTPAFTSINNHLGVDLGCHDNLKSLTYMLIYLLRGSLPWLTSDHEKLSSSSILERKVNTTTEVLCDGIPVEFASVLIYTCSLVFSEDPDCGHLCLLLHAYYLFHTCLFPCLSSLQLASVIFPQIGWPATETNLSWICVPDS